ncbi:MAG: VWA domain-containing protein [Treponema sp.]|jgi:hypothetical protein|nr:VWA domain-containing protein [Treponema sp.]
MMMAKRGLVKKGVFFLIFTWRLVSVAGQQGPVDLILLLDTSASVSGSYREVRDYVTGPFLKEYLRLGDTFHIISFSDKPRLEIARRIEGQGDLEAIIGRVFLLYPLEPGSDIVGALAYLETYLSQLSPSKPKKVVLISDGEMAPELPGAGGIENLMGETKKRLAGKNASFDYISLPLKVGALPSSGRGASVRSRPAVPALVPPSANAPPSRQPVPSPPTEAPPAPRAEVPAMVPPSVAEPPVEELSAAQEETPPAPKASSPQPASAPPAAAGGGFELPAPPVLPPSPAPLPSLPPEITVSDPPVEPAAPASAPGGSARKTSFPFILLALPVLAILGFAVFFLGRRLQESPGRAVARAANLPAPVFSPTTTPESALAEENAGQPPRLDGGPIMLNLFVEDQNTFIGKRNIHVVKPGVNFTIGGGQSDFLIFLVPMPSRIADLRYEDGSCLLIPRKPKYFPDTGSSPVKDCIGKTIRVVSDKDYELFMRIELYEDPLAALNRLMNSVRASPANPRF